MAILLRQNMEVPEPSRLEKLRWVGLKVRGAWMTLIVVEKAE